MDRRQFLARSAAALATGYAVDQLEILERLKAPVRYFFGQYVQRRQVYTLETHVREEGGTRRVIWMKPDESVLFTRAGTVEDVFWHGPLPAGLGGGLARLKLVARPCSLLAGDGLIVDLPSPPYTITDE